MATHRIVIAETKGMIHNRCAALIMVSPFNQKEESITDPSKRHPMDDYCRLNFFRRGWQVLLAWHLSYAALSHQEGIPHAFA